MKLLGGNWFPDHEVHMGEWMQAPKNKIIVDGKQTYQHRKQVAALGYVRRWNVAVDVGAHVGLWSRHLVKRFGITYAFEPVAEHRACFLKNVGNVDQGEHDFSGDVPCVLYPIALGAKPGRVSMWTEQGSSGNTQVREDDTGNADHDVEMRTLDSFDFPSVDFLKIDCEGYELFVLQGAVETLKRCRPVICVEQKPRVLGNFGFKSPEAVTFLEQLGAKVFQHYSGDYMMGWPE